MSKYGERAEGWVHCAYDHDDVYVVSIDKPSLVGALRATGAYENIVLMRWQSAPALGQK